MAQQRQAYSKDKGFDGTTIHATAQGLPFSDDEDDDEEKQWQPDN